MNGINFRRFIIIVQKDIEIFLDLFSYEFYMVPQQITQGTATPTNYNVIYDTSGLSPIQVQKWTWLQSHLYYNWCGTTRVPAVLQYAIKLGFLISNYMHTTPSNHLSENLYFL